MRINLYRIFVLLLSFSLHGFAAAQDLLDPAVAFKFSDPRNPDVASLKSTPMV